MNQKRIFVTDVLTLGAANLLVLATGFWAPQNTFKFIVLINIFGMILIGLRVIQTFLERSRSHYDIKTPRYHALSIAAWWGGAVMAGLLIDIAMKFLEPSELRWPFLGTILFAALGLIFAPLYLVGEWWAARRK